MKIEKLYTLSQFVDHIGFGGELGTTKTLAIIIKYNNFLKQPITKGVLVNGLVKPSCNNPKYLTPFGGQLRENKYKEDAIAFRRAEKKVIFKGAEATSKGYVVVIKNKYSLEFDRNYVLFTDRELYSAYIESLRDLAETTKGELELKNVNL